MLLNQKQTSVAYRCPSCGSVVRSMVGVFGLTADMLRLKCPCGNSEMTVVYTSDKKVRMTVPCFLCPNPHNYTVSSGVFFDRDRFAFACPYSGVDIAFIGNEKNVSEMVDESNRELVEMLGENGIEQIANSRMKKDLFSDPQILDIIMYVIHDLDEAGEIKCRCENGGEYEVEVGDDSVKVSCCRCGASVEIPADSTISANAFLHCDHLELT